MQDSNSPIIDRGNKSGAWRVILNQLIYYYYGNSAGLRNNIGAHHHLNKLRKVYKRKYGLLNHLEGETKADELKQNGYVSLSNVIEENEIRKALQETKIIFETPDRHVKKDKGVILHAVGSEKIKVFQNLFSTKLQNILINYYKCAFRINTVRVWRNLHLENVNPDKDDVFSNTFHNDAQLATSLRIFILLKDGVNRETGALRFHDKQNSKKIYRSGYFSRYGQSEKTLSRLTNPRTLKYFEGNAGDCVILNTQECLHAASIPKKNSYRDILQFEIYPDFGKLKSKEELFNIPEDKEIRLMLN
tara:strand:- start:2544 stop:3452 length:909 start_codon:yes stop_codon:yes gene_type:complete